MQADLTPETVCERCGLPDGKNTPLLYPPDGHVYHENIGCCSYMQTQRIAQLERENAEAVSQTKYWQRKYQEAQDRLGASPEPHWQPIETAPKDGRWIMVFVLGVGSIPGVVHWRHNQWFVCETDEDENYLPFNARPTHWMPIPQAPGLQSETADKPE